MSERRKVEDVLRGLHTARLDANLEQLCAMFTADAHLRIQGTSDGKPIAIAARGKDQIRPWLSVLVKTFRLRDYELLSLTIEGTRAAAHWRANIHSKITGALVATELVDLLEVRDGSIASYVEFFVPC